MLASPVFMRLSGYLLAEAVESEVLDSTEHHCTWKDTFSPMDRTIKVELPR
jgi:hypothetical protein